jgi:hypothetical protein
MGDCQRPREVCEEDERALEDRHEHRFAARIVGSDLRAELANAGA